MLWLIVALIVGILLFFLYRAWSVWQSRFAYRSDELDPVQLFELIHGDQAQAPAPPLATPSILRSPPPQPLEPSPPAAAAVLLQPAARKAVLDEAAQDVYLHLRTELSAYPLLCKVDIAALLPGHHSMLPRVQADFVICKKDFHPVVVILLERSSNDAQLDRAETLLRQQRLRVLRWRAEALPSRDKMRQQIFKPRSESRSSD